jgi:hypothetical protein
MERRLEYCDGHNKEMTLVFKHLPYLLAAMLCACAGQTMVGPITPYMLHSGELYQFVEDVAANRSTMEGYVGGQKVRGVFLGSDECPRVAVLTLSPKGFATDLHHFHACPGNATEYGVGEVPPAFPRTPDARAILENAQRGALLYRREIVHFQRYEITAQTLGIISDRPCLPVETIITHGGLLVVQNTSKVCRDSAFRSDHGNEQ